ncbi:MAG: dihydrofolate reductase family protein [Candidatus Krumholzibacteria bacterium]|nr:dihydrofolate reductase family protein [Candidatus Krumholzibacteria bacterium]
MKAGRHSLSFPRGFSPATRIELSAVRPSITYLISGNQFIPPLCARLANEGAGHISIDGGTTNQGFLAEELVDERVVTVVPIVLGSGIFRHSVQRNA